jgi:hypothetical protein
MNWTKYVAAFVIGLTSSAAYAGTGSYSVWPDQIKVVQGSPTRGIAGNIGGGSNQTPMLIVPSPVGVANTILQFPFRYPLSADGITFNVYINTAQSSAADGVNTCYKIGYTTVDQFNQAFSDWPTVVGNEGTLTSCSITTTTTAYDERNCVAAGGNAVTAFELNQAASDADCADANDCLSNPGLVSLERCECGVDSGCPAGTDANENTYIFGVYVTWNIP